MSCQPRFLIALGATVGLLAVSGASPRAARAATFTVTNCNASGTGSFDQAVRDANSAAGADTINFSVSCTGASAVPPPPSISSDLVIDGCTAPGAVCGASGGLVAGTPFTLRFEINSSGSNPAIDVNGDNVTVRGLVMNRSTSHGLEASGDNGIFEFNYIGTNVAGTSALPQTRDGVHLASANNCIVRDNLISGNTDDGVQINDTSIGNLVSRNVIGMNATQTGFLANGGHGIEISDPAGVDNPFLGNHIAGNSGLGIDLEADGVTPNDTNDPDVGGNHFQNFPALSSAVRTGASTLISGTLDTDAPDTDFRVEVFSNAAADPSNHGEGQYYLGFFVVTTNSSGDASFSRNVGCDTSRNIVTATATRLGASSTPLSTSEFSPTVTASGTCSAGSGPDLGISKMDSADPVSAGASLTYTLAVSNSSPTDSATNIVVSDPLPAGVVYQSASGTGWSCNESGGTVTCNRASLAAASTAPDISIVVTAPGSAGTISNTASVSADETDADSSDNSASEDTTIVSGPLADLAISKSDSADPVAPSSSFSYSLSVTNNGPSAASSVVVTDTLPSGVTYQSAMGSGWACSHASGTVTCTRPSVAASTTAAAITITVTAPASTGTINNSAAVDAAEADPTSGNDSDSEQTTVQLPVDLTQTHYRWRNDDGPEQGGAATIAVDSVTPQSFGAVGSVDVTHTVSGSNRLLLVGISINNDNLETVSNVVWKQGQPDQQSLTLVGAVASADDARVEIWRAVAPPTGTGTLRVTFSTTLLRGGVVGVASFTGVDQTTPLGTFVQAEQQNGPSPVQVTASSAAGELVFDTAACESCTSLTPDPSQTQRWNTNNAGRDFGAGSTKPGAASVTMSWAIPGSSHWAIGAVPIKPAAGGPGATFAAAEDTILTDVDKGVTFRLRFQVSNEGGSSSPAATYRLEVAETANCAAGSYTAVPTAVTGHWQIVGSTFITDGEATANIVPGLTDAAATFVAGQLKDAGNTTGSLVLGPDQFTEHELAVQATTNATDGADYCFRLYDAASGRAGSRAPLQTYGVYGQARLKAAPVDLSISKSDGPDPVAVSSALSYTLQVTNNSGFTANNLVVTDTLPAGVTYQSASGTGWNCSQASGTVTCTRATLAGSSTAPSITINVVAPSAAGTISNSASVSAANPDPVAGNNSDSEDTTVIAGPQADLAITKSDSVDPLLINTVFSYTLSVTNSGPDTANSLTVTDTLPAGVTYQSASGTGWACGQAAGVVTCTRPSLAASSTAPAITITVTSPGSGGSITNDASVAASEGDPVPGNNADSEATTVLTGQADLSIAKSDSADPVLVGASFSYTLSVTNQSTTDPASNLTVTDTLPAGVTYQSASGTGWGCSQAAGVVTCTRATLAAGTTAPAITITVTAPGSAGTITNSASVSATEPDPVAGNNSDSEETTVSVASANLGITKSDSPDPVSIGSTLTYTLSVSNAGPDAAGNLVVTDTLPAGVSYQSASGTGWSCSQGGGVVTCTRASLAAGATAPSITITVNAPASTGTITNIAAVSADEADPASGNNNANAQTTVVAGQIDLSVSQTDSPDPVAPSGSVSYTITVSNAGPDAASNLVVVDSLPAGSSFVSASGTGWTCNQASGIVTCSRASLGSGATAPNIAVSITAPGTDQVMTNDVAVSADEADSAPGNNSDSEHTQVGIGSLGSGAIVVTKIVNGAPAPSSWVFTLSVAQAGCDISAVPNPQSVPGGGGSVTFPDLPVRDGNGTTCEYTVSENSQAGYQLNAAASDPMTLILLEVEGAPVLWGIEEDDGFLFSISDYTQLCSGAAAAGYVDRGRIEYWDGISWDTVNDRMEAFTVDSDGIAYIAANRNLGPTPGPVLLSLDLNNLTNPPRATVVGQIAGPLIQLSDNISGLSIDPISGALYALHRDDNDDVVDRLLILDKTNASIIADLGTMSGLGEEVNSGEDLEFSTDGRLFLSDNHTPDHIYEIDPLTAAIIAIADDNPAGGLGGPVKMEALGWDFEEDLFAFFEDFMDLSGQLTLGSGNNVPFCALVELTDVEGIDFIPTVRGLTTTVTVVNDQVSTYDLALRHTTCATDVLPGEDVWLDIEVFNQGGEDATNVQVIEHVNTAMWQAFSAVANPAGTTSGSVALPYSWAASGNNGVVTITGTLGAGQSMRLPVRLRAAAAASGTVTAYAEIRTDDGADGDSQPESEEGDGTADTTVDNVIDGTGGDEDDLDLASVMVKRGSVGDRVWLDRDSDGSQDVGEPGLAGVTVRLHSLPGGAQVATTRTDRRGNYLFDDVAAGSYDVRIDAATLPGTAGQLVLTPGSSNPSAAVAVTAGSESLGVDFGYGPLAGTAVVGDFVWSDADNDGVQDPGERGLGGVNLNLLDAASGAVVVSTTTRSDGTYLFTGRAPGEYRVQVTSALAGYTATSGPQSVGASISAPFSVAADGAATDLDFGYRNASLFSVTDRMWLDADGDGVQDAAETGLAGVSVNLLDGGGNLLASTTSGTSGSFTFTGVANGTYTLQITDHADVLDSNSGTTASAQAGQRSVTVSGSSVSNVSFGYNLACAIGDFLWLDADADGLQDAGEMAISGVTVELRNSAGTFTFATATTAADGTYLFRNLFAGSFRVVVTDSGSELAGLSQTGDPDGTLDNQGSAAISTTSNLAMDFGYDAALASVAGTVFEDLDLDGLEEGGEPGIAGVTVALLDGSGNVLATTTTDGSGNYLFPGVLAGNYTVAVTDQAGALEGYTLTSGLDAIAVTVAGAPVTDVDFGYARGALTASVGDLVWFDANRDGVQNGSETGLSGVTVRLYADSDGDGLRSGGDTLVATQVSLPSGLYLFSGLAAGRYFADPDESTLPGGFAATPGTGAASALINLSEGEIYDQADFGYAPGVGVALGDQIYVDTDGDGFPDPGEVGIAGVEVRVTGPGGYDVTTTSGADGYYLVTGITVSGAYTVTVNTATLPADLDPQPTAYPSAIQPFNLDVTEGDLLFADFGFQPAGPETRGSIGDTVFLDQDGDGVQDPGEPGLASVTVTLRNAGGVALATTTTDENGNYDFLGLAAASYRVEVTDADGVLAGLNLSAGTNPSGLIALGAGQDYNDADFGYAPSAGTGSIGNLIWHDTNGDGDLDPGEDGIEGILLKLYLDVDQDGVLDAGSDRLIRVTKTNMNGEYYFNSVPLGRYLVKLKLPDDIVAGFTKSVGLVDVDNNSQPDPDPVALDNGGRAPSDFRTDFGFFVSGVSYTISGTIYFDNNGNGLYEPPIETGTAGAKVLLFRDLDGDGILDAGDPFFGSMESAAGGSYSFTNLPDGSDWIVTVDTTGTFLAGGTQTTQLLTAGVEPVAINGANEPNHDFGFTRPPTLALVGELSAADSHGLTQVEWRTVSEVGTLGFFLYRYDPETGGWQQLNDHLLEATGAAQGGSYRFRDEVPAGGSQTYYLVEIEMGGAERHHGPYAVTALERSERDGAERYEAAALAPSAIDHERLQAARAEREVRSARSIELRSAAPVRAARVVVSSEGLQFVPVQTLASAFGLSADQLDARLLPGMLRMTHLGQPVDWWSNDSTGLYFFGEKPSGIYSSQSAYLVELAAGPKADSHDGGSPQPVSGAVFQATRTFEQNLFAGTAAARDPESEYWFWAVLSAGHPSLGTRSFPFSLSELQTASGEARLEVRIFGATATVANPEHSLVFRINGTEVGSATWDGTGARNVTLELPSSVLVAGANTLEITAQLLPEVPFSVLYLDRFEVSYPRAYRAEGDRLRLRADGNAVITVSGLSASDIEVLEVSDPRRPQRVTGTTIDQGDAQGGGYRLSFVPASSGSEYFVQVLSTSTVPAVSSVYESDLLAPALGANYVIVAPESLVQTAERLAEHRAGQGYLTLVVGLQEVYDTFNYGVASPWAIHELLSHAYYQWNVRPEYAVLVGKGSYDYKNYLGAGTNLLPILMAETPSGLFASDTSFGDVAGSDGAPEIAVGRLPVLTVAELDAYIDKLIGYESAGTAAGDDRVVLAADNGDESGAFMQDSQAVAAHLPGGLATDSVNLDEMSVVDARAALLQSLSQGVRLVNYIGHGGMDRFAAEGLLTSADAAALPVSAGRLPIVSSFTCAAGRFEVPGFTSVGESLLFGEDRGAIAVLAPSGLSFNDAARIMNEEFVQSIFEGQVGSLGEAVRRALARYQDDGSFPFMLRIYNLLGDPALPLPPLPVVDDDSTLFSDGFESGDVGAWSSVTN